MRILKESKQIPNLTPIRFILALLVILFHISHFSRNRGLPYYNDLAVFQKGIEAVYMFFSLSGFLIIKQLFNEKRFTNSINLKGFYLRRALRIFPLYYLILTFGFIYYRYLLPHFGFEVENNYDLLTGLILSLTLFPNIFSTYSPGGILEILWSIGVEEQFYLFIAPLFLLLPFKKIITFLIIFTVVYFLLFFSDSLSFLEKYDMLFFYFSFGGLCAILLENDFFNRVIRKFRYPILLLFVMYFTTDVFTDNLNLMHYHLLSCILFGFAISALALKPIKILQNKTMNYLGKISYGIYMYHAIVIHFVGFIYLKILSKFNIHNALVIVIINVSVLILTVIVSHFSYKYFESYFLKFKRRKNVKIEIEI